MSKSNNKKNNNNTSYVGKGGDNIIELLQTKIQAKLKEQPQEEKERLKPEIVEPETLKQELRIKNQNDLIKKLQTQIQVKI